MEVSAETFATFREAMAKLRREAGESLEDDAALLLLARQALGGPSDEGRANYQVALTVCESCRRGWQQGRGEQIEVGADVVEMARCDAQDVGHVGIECPPTWGIRNRSALIRTFHRPCVARSCVATGDGVRFLGVVTPPSSIFITSCFARKVAITMRTGSSSCAARITAPSTEDSSSSRAGSRQASPSGTLTGRAMAAW